MELPSLEESWKPFPFEEKENKTVIFGTDPQKGGKKFGPGVGNLCISSEIPLPNPG